jgi:CheY-like chemotaxis protein/HPt (histidine-containing phosphotransfer) domain-containing protein
MVAEDNATNQMIAAAYLRKGGHHVDVVENGEQAVALVAQKNFDLIFMDVSMPVMDGLAATRAIRAMGEKYEQLPILAMTAHAMRGDRDECLKAGMNGYITKPATCETMLEAVQHWAGTPVDPILSCNEICLPGHNPDGSAVLLPQDFPCEDMMLFPEETPEISEEAFRQLLKDLGETTFVQYGRVFHADISMVGRNLAAAAEKEDWSAVKLNAHSIKSSVLSFGLVKLSCLAEKIEQQCMQRGKAEMELVRQFPEAWDNAIAALNGRFTAMGLPAVS